MDPTFLTAFRAGEREALTRVYRLYARDVEGVVRRALASVGGTSPADLADLVQDVFVRAFSETARASYDGVREYRPYLLILARNVFLDWVRNRGREIPSSGALEVIFEHAAEDSEWPVFESPLVEIATQYVESLAPELRAAHHQRFVLAASQDEAARALGISRQMLRTQERKLLDGLRRELRRAGVRVAPALRTVRESLGPARPENQVEKLTYARRR